MKVCARCSDECFGRDGDNTCHKCKEKPFARTKDVKRAREAALRSIGLTKIKGANGGTYWE